jgi:hypothetical protein
MVVNNCSINLGGPMMARRAIAVALLASAVLGACGGGSGSGNQPSASDWFQTHQGDVRALANALDALHQAGVRGDAAGANSACGQMRPAADSLQADLPSPNSTANSAFSEAVTSAQQASDECQRGIASNDAATIQRAGNDATSAVEQLAAATKAIRGG